MAQIYIDCGVLPFTSYYQAAREYSAHESYVYMGVIMQLVLGIVVGLCLSAVVYCGIGVYFSLKENEEVCYGLQEGV